MQLSKARVRVIAVAALMLAGAALWPLAQSWEGDAAPRPGGNGVVTATDWTLVGRFAAGLAAPAEGGEFQRADCAPRGTFGDGFLTASDWVQAGRYAAGLDPLAPAAGPQVGPDPVVGTLCYVPAGTFFQGSPADEPCRYENETQFTHTLTRSLAVMETEVTRQMWADLGAEQPSLPADPTDTAFGSGMTNPVQRVTWYEAALFANLLSAQNALTPCYYADAGFTVPLDAANYAAGPVYCDWSAGGYRLPTEGEWEYACRAGTATPFWVAEPNYTAADCGLGSTPGMYPQLETAAWFWGNSILASSPAGTKAANAWGLRDVHGNVWEWCWDWYGTYPTGSATDYHGADSGSSRVSRGGGWVIDAQGCRAAGRYGDGPGGRFSSLGFRLARVAR